MILSRIIIGLITFVIAILGIAVDNKKNGKITNWGWAVFILLTLLAGFTIYSDLSKEISEKGEKEQRQNQELKIAKKREAEYKESINYFTTLSLKSEQTLAKFDSSAKMQNMLLAKAQQMNNEFEKSKQVQFQIHQLSQTSLDALSKNLLQVELLNQAQVKSILKLDTLNLFTGQTMTNLNLLGNEIDNLTMPISPFKLVLKMKVYLDDTALVKYSKSVTTEYNLFAHPLGKRNGGTDYFIGFPLFGKNSSVIKNYNDFRNYLFSLRNQMTVLMFGAEYEYEYDSLPELFNLTEADNSLWFNVGILFKKIKTNEANYKSLRELFNSTSIQMRYHRFVSKEPFTLLLNKNEKKMITLTKMEFLPQVVVYYGKNLENERAFYLSSINKNLIKWIRIGEMDGYNQLEANIYINLRDSL